jgi:hypothetical protein
MSGIKISDLPAAASALGAMQLEVNDAGTSRRVTADQIVALAGGPGSWVEISRATASNSATVDFTGLSTDYDEYAISLYNIVPADATEEYNYLLLRTSSNNGSSYDSGSEDYLYSFTASYAARTYTGGGYSRGRKEPYIKLNDYGVRNLAADGGVSGLITIVRPNSAKYFSCTFDTVEHSSLPNGNDILQRHSVAGLRDSTTAVNAIRFYFLTGNIASGVFVLLGRRK